jgi:hypothetical protein
MTMLDRSSGPIADILKMQSFVSGIDPRSIVGFIAVAPSADAVASVAKSSNEI